MPSPTAPQPLPSDGTRLLMMMIIMPAMNAAIEPTDRSRPPEVMTKVAPIAMMPMNDDARDDVGEVGEAEEIAVEQRAEDHQQQQRHQRPERAEADARRAGAGVATACRRCVMPPCPLDAHLVPHDLLLR